MISFLKKTKKTTKIKEKEKKNQCTSGFFFSVQSSSAVLRIFELHRGVAGMFGASAQLCRSFRFQVTGIDSIQIHSHLSTKKPRNRRRRSSAKYLTLT